MVVFTCQHCNATLKKTAVLKHYSRVCRNTPYLTCIDCLKDFRDDEYNAHNKCLTEEERYGDINYKPKPTAIKQTAWIDIVNLCAEKNKDPRYKSLFSKLVSYGNVPRKRNKFMNFIKSSLPSCSPDISTAIFDMIEVEFNEQKKKGSNVVNNEHMQKTNESPDLEMNVKENNEKRKNKTKKLESITAENEEKIKFEDFSKLFNIKVKNKKMSLKNGVLNNSVDQLKEKENVKCTENEEESHLTEDIDTEIKQKLSKKELKKIKKKQKYEAELKDIEESETKNNIDKVDEVNDQELIKTSKKYKKRKATLSESEEGVEKRRKVEEIEEIKVAKDSGGEEQGKNDKAKVIFNWEEMIKEVLRKSSSQEMSIKRISKKVLAEYQAVKGERESYEQLISKFNKKINKTVGVRVLKDKAKLISDD